MAHLCGLCIALERASDQSAYRTLQRSLNGNPKIEKPAAPKRRGNLTIADVLATTGRKPMGCFGLAGLFIASRHGARLVGAGFRLPTLVRLVTANGQFPPSPVRQV
jgi:hypothetical protein